MGQMTGLGEQRGNRTGLQPIGSLTLLIALTMSVQLCAGAIAEGLEPTREVSVERQAVRRISASVVRALRDIRVSRVPAAAVAPPMPCPEPTQLCGASGFGSSTSGAGTELACWLIDLPPPGC